MNKNKSVKRTILILSSLLLLAVSFSALSQGGDQNNKKDDPSITGAENYDPERILVKFRTDVPDVAKAALLRAHGHKVLDVLPQLDVFVVQVPANSIREKVREYEDEPLVEYAEPDYIAYAAITPSDTYYSSQWHLPQIQAPGAWDFSTSSSAIKIAICDTGIDQNHEDLTPKIAGNANFSGSTTQDDLFGHGTHVAGIAAAATNNRAGVAGVGFNAVLLNVKVLGDDGSGNYSAVANGIRWAADNGARVINLSLAGSSASTTLKSAVDYAWKKGSVLVAAAGNANNTVASYPAYYSNCVSVAATDFYDAKAGFSSYGSSWVDIAAPGSGIFSTLPNHTSAIGTVNYGNLSGTSMATPVVSGVAALVWTSKYGKNNKSVRNQIQSTADAAGTMWTTYGIKRVNALKAVQ